MSSCLNSLNQMPIGSLGIVKALTAKGFIYRRMLDLGLIYGTKVEALRRNSAGDLTAYQIRGAVIAFRLEEAEKILVEQII